MLATIKPALVTAKSATASRSSAAPDASECIKMHQKTRGAAGQDGQDVRNPIEANHLPAGPGQEPQDAAVCTADSLEDSAAKPLSGRQSRALDLMLQGCSATSIARELNVDRTTLYRWRQKPVFRRSLEDRRAEIQRAADARLGLLVSDALDLLEERIQDEQYHNDSLDAAKFVLRLALSRPREGRGAPEPSAN